MSVIICEIIVHLLVIVQNKKTTNFIFLHLKTEGLKFFYMIKFYLYQRMHLFLSYTKIT